ncbi:MAG: type IV toxin-antitoxin system AbiEi family antitoxin domain-containing protein [Deltaproteobacteria bacterium]|nr:type IV toxin-antitoxin system AbiEi family antitoxin domain-containing protein [Deltaproteobacteria bacterium]
MHYEELLKFANDLPVIESAGLRSLGLDPKALSVQLNRWIISGKLIQLRRGVYLLPEHLRRNHPSAEVIANLLLSPSYVSCERALAIYQMIPENVPVVQSVTTKRAAIFATAEGQFDYKHAPLSWFFGYQEMFVSGHKIFVATPDKALADLLYFSKGELTAARFYELRLQNTEQLDWKEIADIATRTKKPQFWHTMSRLRQLLVKQEDGWNDIVP